MALETTPFMVGGGAEHSAGIARSIAYAATGGKEGIGAPGDLKVAAQSVPNGTVRVYPGVATILNSYAGGTGQSYVAKNLSQTNVTIQPTGSTGGRSDLIVLSVTDPEFEGEAPADPNNFNYTRLEVISGVPSTTTSLDEIEYPRPAIPLARIDIPANTGTITSGMIKNLRFLANPRTERKLYVYPLVQSDGIHKLDNYRDIGDWWVNPKDVSNWYIDVPEWAQRVRIIGQAGGVKIQKGSGNAWGRVWARIGSIYDDRGVNTQETSWDLDSGDAGNVRESWITGADRTVPANIRGEKGMYVGIRGRVISADNSASLPILDSLSVISVDVEFYETAI